MQREDEIRQGWRVYIPIDPSDVNREKARKTLANILEKDIRYDVPDQAEPGKEICVYMDYDLSRHQFVKTP